MKIIAHRAINFRDPENSIKAFEWALNNNYCIELDIYLTADGIPVISHDISIDRMFDGKGNIPGMTLDQLRRFRFKHDPLLEISTFEDVCKLYCDMMPKDIFFCIQIKDMHQKEVVEKVYALVAKYNLPSDSFLFEVDNNTMPLVDLVRQRYPDMKVALHLYENSPYFSREHFSKADIIWADETTFDWMSKDMVELAHSCGKQIYAISAELIPHSKNAPYYMKRWEDLAIYGFDGICTDHPQELEMFLKNNKLSV